MKNNAAFPPPDRAQVWRPFVWQGVGMPLAVIAGMAVVILDMVFPGLHSLTVAHMTATLATPVRQSRSVFTLGNRETLLRLRAAAGLCA